MKLIESVVRIRIPTALS